MCAGIPDNIITYKLLSGAGAAAFGASGASGAGAATSVACASPWVAVRTGALVFGGVVLCAAGVATIYAYRREIREIFKCVWDKLKNLISSILGLAKDVLKDLTDMAHAALTMLYTMVNDTVEWLISFIPTTKNLSKEDQEKAFATVEKCFDGATKLGEDLTQDMTELMNKNGASQKETETFKENFKAPLLQTREEYEKLKDKLKRKLSDEAREAINKCVETQKQAVKKMRDDLSALGFKTEAE